VTSLKKIEVTRDKDVVFGNRALMDDIFRAEVTLEKLPYFCPDKMTKLNQYYYEKEVYKDGKILNYSIKITAAADQTIPGPFDHNVYRALQILTETKGIKHDRSLSFKISEILKILKKSGGTYTEMVKNSLQKLGTTSILAEYAIFDKFKKSWVGDTTRVLDRVTVQGEKFGEGTGASVADKTRVVFSEWYVNNLLNKYHKPLDGKLYFSLKYPLAQALYGYLDLMFYPLQRGVPFKIEYSNLCGQLIITRQSCRSLALHVLQDPVNELIGIGFLSAPYPGYQLMEPIAGVKNDFVFNFFPGPGAIKNMKNYSGGGAGPALAEPRHTLLPVKNQGTSLNWQTAAEKTNKNCRPEVDYSKIYENLCPEDKEKIHKEALDLLVAERGENYREEFARQAEFLQKVLYRVGAATILRKRAEIGEKPTEELSGVSG